MINSAIYSSRLTFERRAKSSLNKEVTADFIRIEWRQSNNFIVLVI